MSILSLSGLRKTYYRRQATQDEINSELLEAIKSNFKMIGSLRDMINNPWNKKPEEDK